MHFNSEGDSISLDKATCSEISEIWSDKMEVKIQPQFTLVQMDKPQKTR